MQELYVGGALIGAIGCIQELEDMCLEFIVSIRDREARRLQVARCLQEASRL